jgi:hypothetical protein
MIVFSLVTTFYSRLHESALLSPYSRGSESLRAHASHAGRIITRNWSAKVSFHAWFPKGRRVVHQAIIGNEKTRCWKCYKGHTKPYCFKLEPPLPDVRLPIEGDENKRPFQDTGLDYFGPVRYKSKKGDVKTFHVALFDCLTYRAIHLEVVKDLTAESCLGALRKFFSARGRPQTMLTDKASYFKAAKRAVTVAEGETVIEWNWTTPLAPWTGGTHERLDIPNC